MKKHSMKKVLVTGIAMALLLSMTACGNAKEKNVPAGIGGQSTAGQSTAGTTGQSEVEQSTTPVDIQQAEKPVQTEPLIVYLNDFDGVIVDMFKEATGYDVEVVSGNGAETMSRIAAEKGNPQWDVVWIDSMYDVFNLSNEGELLTEWQPENAANLTEFASALVPENMCMYPTGAHASALIVYRNDIYTEETAPKTFAELADEKYKNAVGMADPGVAAPAYPTTAYFMDNLGLEEGKAYFTKMFDNGLHVYPKNPQVVNALASGEINVAMLQESNAYDMVSSGEPISIIWPEDGAPASTRVVAISASSDQIEIANIFVNFLLDADTQQKLIDTGDEGYFEASVKDVVLKKEREENAKLVVADVVFGAENEADIKAWFADMSVR